MVRGSHLSQVIVRQGFVKLRDRRLVTVWPLANRLRSGLLPLRCINPFLLRVGSSASRSLRVSGPQWRGEVHASRAENGQIYSLGSENFDPFTTPAVESFLTATQICHTSRYRLPAEIISQRWLISSAINRYLDITHTSLAPCDWVETPSLTHVRSLSVTKHMHSLIQRTFMKSCNYNCRVSLWSSISLSLFIRTTRGHYSKSLESGLTLNCIACSSMCVCVLWRSRCCKNPMSHLCCKNGASRVVFPRAPPPTHSEDFADRQHRQLMQKPQKVGRLLGTPPAAFEQPSSALLCAQREGM